MPASADLSPQMWRSLNHPVLPREEVRKLIAEAQRGGKAAIERLVRHNMRMVFKIAIRYTFAMPLEDLMQEGVLGLLKAVSDFDLKTNNCLATYAHWWIAAFCKRAAQRATGMPAINRASQRHLVQAHTESFVSLDAMCGDAGKDLTYHDILPSEAPAPDEIIHQRFLAEFVRREVNRSAKDRRDVAVASRIADRKDRDFELGRLGAQFGVSRERIRQLELRMRGRLAKNRRLRKLANEA